MLEFPLDPGIPADPQDGCQDSHRILGSLPPGSVPSLSLLQVRISYFREASGVPVGRAVLYLTCVGKGDRPEPPFLNPHS